MKIWVESQVLLNKLNLSILHWVNFLKKGWIKMKTKKGLLKRLKNIENAQKKLIKDDDNESIYYTPRSQFGSEDDKDNKKQQNNNIDIKPPKISDYLKSLSQESKDLTEKIEDADNDVDKYKLAFIGSNPEKFNFNIFRWPLTFLSAIYNGELSLKEAEISQREIRKKINKLKFNYRPENEEEKEEVNQVLMLANDLLEYRDKIINAFTDGIFLSEHLKKSDDAAHDYMLENVNDFIQKIKSMAEKINLSLFEDFFESPLPTDYAKMLINTKKASENKEFIAKIKKEHQI